MDISTLAPLQKLRCEQAGKKAIDAFIADEDRAYWFNYTLEGASEMFLKAMMLGLGVQIAMFRKRPDAHFVMDFIKYMRKEHWSEQAA